MSTGRPKKKRGRKDKQKLFGKKKELLPSLLYKRSKSNHDPTKFRKERKKAVFVLPQKKATPRLDSVFKNSVTHSFFSREAYFNDLL